MEEKNKTIEKKTVHVHILPDGGTDGGCFFYLLSGLSLLVLAASTHCQDVPPVVLEVTEVRGGE